MLSRGCYPIFETFFFLFFPLLILQFSKCPIIKMSFPFTLPHHPSISLSFSICYHTLSSRLPSAFLPPLTITLPFIHCHLVLVCIILLKLPRKHFQKVQSSHWIKWQLLSVMQSFTAFQAFLEFFWNFLFLFLHRSNVPLWLSLPLSSKCSSKFHVLSDFLFSLLCFIHWQEHSVSRP